MDAFILDKATTCDHHSHSKAHLLDKVTRSVISVDEWIAQELDRLSHNHLPRNCSNYEALVSVVEVIFQSEQLLCLEEQHNRSVIYPKEEQKNTIHNDLLTQKNLVLAFSQIIHYCRHELLVQHFNRRPLELVIELEKMHEMLNTNQHLDVVPYQEKLSQIVFGTPIVSNLVSSWTMICLWVQQEVTSEERKWIVFGVYSYQMAKKLCAFKHCLK